MVLLICLTFVGQAMASTVVSYHMMNMQTVSSQGMSHNMADMEHCADNDNKVKSSNKAQSAALDDTATSTDDCCAKTCNCFTGSCSTVAALIKDINTAANDDFSAKILSTSSLAKSQQLTSLYRPPIH